MVWRYGGIVTVHKMFPQKTFPQNVVLVRLMGSEKTIFTDRRTTDACPTSLALLTQSIRLKNYELR